MTIISKNKVKKERKTRVNKPFFGQFHQEKTEKLIEEVKLLEIQRDEVIRNNPFWFYEPSTGEIPLENLEFLKEFIKEEDIPVRIDAQIDVHMSTANVIGAIGGNQSGKTIAGCIEAFIAATGEVPYFFRKLNEETGIEEITYPKEKLPTLSERPFPIRVVGEDDLNGLQKNVIPKYRAMCPKEYLKENDWSKSFTASTKILTLYKNGKEWATIEFMSNKQDVGSFQGPGRKLIIYDEEPNYEIWKENRMRFTTAKRIREIFCMTPTKGMSWVYDEIILEDSEGAKAQCFKMSSVTNKSANLSVLREIVEALGSYEEIKMRILGEFVSLSGRVYKVFDKNLHVIEPFEIKWSDYTVYKCFDIHQTTPTAAVWLAVDRDENVFIIDSYWGDKANDVHEVKEDFENIEVGNKWRMGWSVVDRSCDSDIEILGGLNVFKELLKPPHRIQGLRKSVKYSGSIDAGVEQIKRRLKLNKFTNRPTLFFFNTPNNKVIIRSMQTLEREVGIQEEKTGPKDKIKEGKHHHHSAMRFGFQYPLRFIPPTFLNQLPKYNSTTGKVAY